MTLTEVQQQNGHHHSEDQEINNISPYDDRLSSMKDPYFMRPIRLWEKRQGFVTPIIWINVFFISIFHLACVFGWIYILFVQRPKWQTVLILIIATFCNGFGVTGGVHRYWTHRTYKAKLPLKIFLLICYTIAGQNTIYEWVRDHRIHHKHSETSADPHDANRGFFFSHVGWLMMKKHPHVIRAGKNIDMSDIENDSLIQFHTRYFTLFKILGSWVIPSAIPWVLFDESLVVSVVSQVFVRYVTSLNFTWSVNSFAHLWGNKPYDPNIMPSENRWVSIVAIGEGWHNYHHTFPWDYKAAEFGSKHNLTSAFLNFFVKIGWAYDLKEASYKLVKSVVKRRCEEKYKSY